MNKESGNNKVFCGSSVRKRGSYRLRQRLGLGVREVESKQFKG